jgi:hypothetical protein
VFRGENLLGLLPRYPPRCEPLMAARRYSRENVGGIELKAN